MTGASPGRGKRKSNIKNQRAKLWRPPTAEGNFIIECGRVGVPHQDAYGVAALMQVNP